VGEADFPGYYAVQDNSGQMIATVPSIEYAKEIQALPEILAANQEVLVAGHALLERLRAQYPQWGPQSPLGLFAQAMDKLSTIKKTS
jgi:hypothetical protein